MTIRLSTGLRNAITAQRAVVKHALIGRATLALVDGGAGNDSITDSTSGLGGFTVHDKITIIGPTTPANAGSFEMLSVAAGVIQIPTGSVNTAQTLPTTAIIASSRGGSISDLFRNGYLQAYTGSQPSDPDAAATGTLLGTYSLSAGTFTPGTATNGLNFDEVSAGTMSKDVSETWQTTAVAGGTAGWFRFMSNSSTPSGTGIDQIRFDGNVATSGANLNMPITTFVLGTTYSIDTFPVIFPAV